MELQAPGWRGLTPRAHVSAALSRHSALLIPLENTGPLGLLTGAELSSTSVPHPHVAYLFLLECYSRVFVGDPL